MQLRSLLPTRPARLPWRQLQVRSISQSDALSSRRATFLNNGMSKAERDKRLADTMKEVNKQFGAGSLMNLGDNSRVEGVQFIPTGIPTLDVALGGGVPAGRVIEIYGSESSGKTSLALAIAGQVQKMDGTVAFIDVEHSMDPLHAQRMGCDVRQMLVNQPQTMEEALAVVEKLARGGMTNLVVVDSVAALVPRAEIEGELSDSEMALRARIMSKALRIITPLLGPSNMSIIFINQIRMKVGVYAGNPDTTPGGNALKFHASQRIQIKALASDRIKDKKGQAIGNRVKVQVQKNKVARPFASAECDLYYSTGFDKVGATVEAAVYLGLLQRRGAYYYQGNEALGQGRAAVVAHFMENPEELRYGDVVVGCGHCEWMSTVLYRRVQDHVEQAIAEGQGQDGLWERTVVPDDTGLLDSSSDVEPAGDEEDAA